MLPIFTNKSGDYAIYAMFFAEISNPCMHMKNLLRTSGRRYTLAYDLFDVCFLVIYSVCRGVIVLPTAASCFDCDQSHVVFQILMTGIMLQSYYFIFKMVTVNIGHRYKEIKLKFKLTE